MPSLEIDFEVYCGICKRGVCFHTEVKNNYTLTITCPDCKDKIKSLKNDVKLLKIRVRDLKKGSK